MNSIIYNPAMQAGFIMSTRNSNSHYPQFIFLPNTSHPYKAITTPTKPAANAPAAPIARPVGIAPPALTAELDAAPAPDADPDAAVVLAVAVDETAVVNDPDPEAAVVVAAAPVPVTLPPVKAPSAVANPSASLASNPSEDRMASPAL